MPNYPGLTPPPGYPLQPADPRSFTYLNRFGGPGGFLKGDPGLLSQLQQTYQMGPGTGVSRRGLSLGRGGLGGAAKGAMTGASIGSIIPGIGTGIGAGIGGLLGWLF